MLPDNFDALNAYFRDTVVNIIIVKGIKLLLGDRTFGIKKLLTSMLD